METCGTARTAFSVRDILNMPESKEKEMNETKDAKISMIKSLPSEEIERPPSCDERTLKESTLKGKIILYKISILSSISCLNIF